MIPVYETPDGMNGAEGSQQGNDQPIFHDYVKCGYGKLIWPDYSSFEGYWIDNQACGLGVFRAPSDGEEVYEGLWQQDNQTGLAVFR